MKVERAELLLLTLPLVEPFGISGGVMRERRSLIVVLHDGAGAIGYGESPPFELPFYSEETLAGARRLLEDLLLPRIVGHTFESPEAVHAALRVGVRGNPFARAAVETAAWDLEACRGRQGLAQRLGQRLGVTPAARIPCGVALGIPEGRDLGRLVAWIEEAVARGYRRVKLKVAPGWDAQPLEAARRALERSGLPLTVDANGAYDWPEHESNLRALDGAGLLYIEQPLAPDELVGHARLADVLATPVCLDETLRDARAARQVLALGGPTVWNLKVHRMGGLTETLAVQRIATAAGVRLWAGTMPESGLGSQAAIAAAALPGFVFPSDVEPSARWFGAGRDVIELEMSPDGYMAVPDRPLDHLLDKARFRAATTALAAFPR